MTLGNCRGWTLLTFGVTPTKSNPDRIKFRLVTVSLVLFELRGGDTPSTCVTGLDIVRRKRTDGLRHSYVRKMSVFRQAPIQLSVNTKGVKHNAGGGS